MFTQKPSPIAVVSPGVPALLQKNYIVKFSNNWPSTLPVTRQIADVTQGKYFKIIQTNQVPYDLDYIIPANDFRDVDFSNTLTNFNINLYPNSGNTLYEIQLGFKQSNFLAHFMIPAGEFLSRLEQASMIPNTVDARLRYLGARKWQDSPYDNKSIYIYTIMNMDALIMRLFVDSGFGVAALATDFEKVITGIIVNKCKLVEIVTPNEYQEKVAKEIPYYTDIRW